MSINPSMGLSDYFKFSWEKIMKKGFTLIELLVVVLIIGILSAIALPQYTKAVEKSRAAEAMTLLKAIETAENAYYMANGEYTEDLSSLDLEFPNVTSSYAFETKNFEFSVGVATANNRNVSVTASAERKSNNNYKLIVELSGGALESQYCVMDREMCLAISGGKQSGCAPRVTDWAYYECEA